MPRMVFDTAAKVRRMAYLRGLILPEGDEEYALVDAKIAADAEMSPVSIRITPFDVEKNQQRFEISALAADDFDFSSVVLDAEFLVGGTTLKLSFDHEAIERVFLHHKYTVMNTWKELIQDDGVSRIIDIGGRARSGISRKGLYPGKTVVVADIMNAADVDIVADVHELSRHVQEEYDAFMSIATFEHLLMPWKAAVEINKVLRMGGVGLVVTHQTVGMHEIPWDFYRYSSYSWKGIFNEKTGFEVLDCGMTVPTMIIPLRWEERFNDTEGAVGFMTSSAVVRKIADPHVDWPVTIPSITQDMYPH